jgi:hypothetical protein
MTREPVRLFFRGTLFLADKKLFYAAKNAIHLAPDGRHLCFPDHPFIIL